jgi:hypothetical protein
MNLVAQPCSLFKKMVFLALGSAALLLMAASAHAQAPTDPCTPALPVSLDTTGCGALITVYSVDANGSATSFAVSPTGLAYDSERDDWLIGIVNNSTGSLKSITLTTPTTSTEGIFAFDGDGPCNFNLKDCFGSRFNFSKAPYYGYAGPDNTYTSITSGGKSGTVSFTTSIPNVGSCAAQFCNSTWFALEGLPVTDVTELVNPVTATVTANFSSGDPITLIQVIDFPSSTTNPNGSNMFATTNFPIPPAITGATPGWPEYIVGTPWAPSLCIPKLANGGVTPPCSLYVNACWNSATQTLATASDAFCPTAVLNSPTPSEIVLQDIFDWTKQPIANGTTVSLIAFTPPLATPYLQWAPSSASVNPVCANILEVAASPAVPCYITDRLYEMYGDQTTTRGKSPSTKSWNISAYHVPMLLTGVSAKPNAASNCPLTSAVALNDPNPLDGNFEIPTFTTGNNQWFNGNCLIDFTVYPAGWVFPSTPSTPSSANNYFVAADPAELTFGNAVGPFSGVPALPLSNSTVTNPAAPWDTLSALGGLTLGTLAGGDGAGQTLNWSAEDSAGIIEKNIQLVSAASQGGSCPVPSDAGGGIVAAPVGGQCYLTSEFNVLVNIDSVAPALQSCTQSPAAPVYMSWFKTEVTESCTILDALSGLNTATIPTTPAVPIPGPNASASFGLTTNVGAGNETSSALTNSGKFCDYAQNCTTVQKGSFEIDEKPPVIGGVTLTPSGGTYLLNQAVTASFGCTDGGSGVSTCNGTPVSSACTASGSPASTTASCPVDTRTVGMFTFTTAASDNVGNVTPGPTPSVKYAVGDFSISLVNPINPQIVSSGGGAPVTAKYTIAASSATLIGSITISCVISPALAGTCSVPPITLGSNSTTQVLLNPSKSAGHGSYQVAFTGTYCNAGGACLSHTTSPTVTLTIK